ncbi:MAG TPA: hypothetical protein VFS25_10570 [Chitinophaga sp.]|uniref:hypothetical protein n=1 Tax=Chitinophaga sp. TaxID=1869181 RepID=UPI002DBF9D7A|nr:hypothetical protein [Chitinophaga sp.]HEU4553270.1 hypothetical protein [Chitinophaga sp.]
MNKKGKDIAEELKEVVPGLNLPATAPFTVPEGYFNTLPHQIMQGIKAAEAAGMPVQEELAALSSLLAGIPRQPRQAPQGYFAALPNQVMAAIAAQEKAPAKVISITASRRRYMPWAAAACIAGCLAIGALFLFRGGAVRSTNSLDAQLAAISDQEIVDYLQMHSDAFDNDAIFTNVSSEDVVEELPKISTDLSSLPAEAIQKYLENTDWSN